MTLKQVLNKGEILEVIVLCNSKFQEISENEGIYKVRLTSQPIKDKANKELLKFFKSLGYDIEIIKGKRSNNKLIKIL